MSPHSIPWWGYLLLAVPFYAFGLVAAWQYEAECFVRSPSERTVAWFKVCWYGCWVIAALCAVGGIIRFLRWV